MDVMEPIPQEEPRDVPAEQLILESATVPAESADTELLAILEALVYVTDEPLTAEQIASALGQPRAKVEELLERLSAEYNMPEHHDAIRAFVKKLQPLLKLSLPALETLALIAYKQPITAPEVMEIRGVQGAGVLKTLLDRKLITTAGRKNVVGRPILYKTTREFLVQFGLKDLSELPTLKEFEELRRMAVSDEEEPPPQEAVESAGPAAEPGGEEEAGNE
jgi:segregation and condensation protein B